MADPKAQSGSATRSGEQRSSSTTSDRGHGLGNPDPAVYGTQKDYDIKAENFGRSTEGADTPEG